MDRALLQQSAAVVVMGPAAAAARREEQHQHQHHHHHHLNRELSVHVRHNLQGPTNNNPEFFCKNPGPLASSSASSYPPAFQEPQRQHQNHGDSKQQLQGSFFSERLISVPTSSVVSPSSTVTEVLDTKQHPPPPIPVKLFGVPLHSQSSSSNNDNNSEQLQHERVVASELPRPGTKRQHPEAPWEAVSEHPHDRVQFPRPPPRKCLGSSEIIGSDPLISRPAPWLQICATRDEGVYI